MGETAQWIDPDGTATDIDVLNNVNGRHSPPPVFDEYVVPGQPGARVRAARHGVREVALPIGVEAADTSALRTAVRDLMWAMDPVRGDSRLRFTTPVGDQRELTCRVVEGLGLSENGEDTTPTFQRVVVVVRAHDPYWYAVSPVVATYEIGETPSFFPIFPLRLTSSEIAVDTTVNNVGDVDAWPVWTITGPGSTIVLRNLTTSKVIDLASLSLVGGQTITIDTRPGAKTVTLNDGTSSSNVFSDLSNTSSLWPLRRGANSVRLEMGSAVAGQSNLQLSFKPRYLGA